MKKYHSTVCSCCVLIEGYNFLADKTVKPLQKVIWIKKSYEETPDHCMYVQYFQSSR